MSRVQKISAISSCIHRKVRLRQDEIKRIGTACYSTGNDSNNPSGLSDEGTKKEKFVSKHKVGTAIGTLGVESEEEHHAPQQKYLHSTPPKVPVQDELPKRARVVIAGSGLVGNSVAYHLMSRHGWKDVVVIDKGKIADGTSKYGSGMLGLFRPSHERTIVQKCIELYRDLQFKKGFDIGLITCGSLNLAASRDRMISLERRANRYRPTGLDCQVVSPQECSQLHPYLYTEDIQGGVWVPEDVNVHPKKVSEVLAHLAYQGGTKFVGECAVERVLTGDEHNIYTGDGDRLTVNNNNNVRVKGVETSKGTIECEYFVNCSGIWARHLGKLSNPEVKVPICVANHFFLTFTGCGEEDLRGKSYPNVRDYDNHVYIRNWRDSFLIGAYEKIAWPFQSKDVESKQQSSNWAKIDSSHWVHMSEYISSGVKRMPVLRGAQYDYLLNTPDAFTPDGRWILGQSSEVSNYYVCAGMNGNSLQAAGGVGEVTADWIVKGRPPPSLNMLPFEVQRFTAMHNNSRYLFERTHEVVATHFQLTYPLPQEFKRARNLRTSPLFPELEARGAVFTERMGWERPLYFEPYHARGDPPAKLPEKGTFGKPTAYFDIVADEYQTCRDGVGVVDMSSFTKFSIKGRESDLVSYLQNLCVKDVDIEVGGVVSTPMLNEAGGHENDCLLIRRSPTSYFMVSPTQQQTRIRHWMNSHLVHSYQNQVQIKDLTSMYTVLSLVGPKSGDLLQEMTMTNVTKMDPLTFKILNVGYSSNVIILKSASYASGGEMGFTLFIPSDSSLSLYDQIMTRGADFGVRNIGYLALRNLRIERFLPFWGEEVTSDTTPVEVGPVDSAQLTSPLKSGAFIGKEVMEQQKVEGVSKRLVQFTLLDFNSETDYWPGGGEALFRDGKYVGSISNAAFGFTVNKMVCLGFVRHPDSFINSSGPSSDKVVTDSWILDETVTWTMNIARRQITCKPYIHKPRLPTVEQMKRLYIRQKLNESGKTQAAGGKGTSTVESSTLQDNKTSKTADKTTVDSGSTAKGKKGQAPPINLLTKDFTFKIHPTPSNDKPS